MAKRVRAIVTGIVQGVGYRASTAREAQRLQLVGWVRNLPDGSVELEAEGPEHIVDTLIEWCRRGPPSSDVEDVRVEPREVVGERAFAVRY